MRNEEKRKEIATLLRAGHTVLDTVNLTSTSKSTVFKVKKLMEEGQDLKDKPRSGRPQKVDLRAMEMAFKANPRLKLATFAKDNDLDKSTVSKALKKVGGKSLRLVERPLLTKKHLEFRQERCRVLLNNLKHSVPGRIIIFSDEKTFTVDPVVNRQNDRAVAFLDNRDTVEQLRTISKTKHPASVMMLGVVASNGAKMDPIWFKTGYRLTAADYLVILKDKVLP